MKIVWLVTTVSLGLGLVINQTKPEEALISDLDRNAQKYKETQINDTDGNNWTRPLKLIEEPIEDILEKLISVGSISEVKAKIEELKDNPEVKAKVEELKENSQSIANNWKTIGNFLGSFYQMKHKNILGEVHNGPKVEEHQAFLSLLGEKEHIQEALENLLGKRVTPQAQRLFDLDREAFLNILEVSPRTRRQFSPKEDKEKEKDIKKRITTLFHNIFKDHKNFMLVSPTASNQTIIHEDKQVIRRSRRYSPFKAHVKQSLLDLLGQQFSLEWQSQSSESSKHVVDECYQEACEGRACQCCNCITCWSCNVKSEVPQPPQIFSSSSPPVTNVPIQELDQYRGIRDECYEEACEGGKCQCCNCLTCWSCFIPKTYTPIQIKSSPIQIKQVEVIPTKINRIVEIKQSLPLELLKKLITIKDVPHYSGIRDSCYQEIRTRSGSNKCCNCLTCWSCLPALIKPIENNLHLELVTLFPYEGIKDSCYEQQCEKSMCQCCNCVTCWSC